MSFTPFRAFLVSVACLFIISGCVGPEESNIDSNKLRPNINTDANSNAANADPNANVAKDDENRLNELIKLPFEPEENVWRQDEIKADANTNQAPGPAGTKLTAVLKFSEKDSKELLSKAAEKDDPFETDLEPESWFPADLIAKSETSGDSTLKGMAHNADAFIKPPYASGSLIKINETDYFVLVLRTK